MINFLERFRRTQELASQATLKRAEGNIANYIEDNVRVKVDCFDANIDWNFNMPPSTASIASAENSLLLEIGIIEDEMARRYGFIDDERGHNARRIAVGATRRLLVKASQASRDESKRILARNARRVLLWGMEATEAYGSREIDRGWIGELGWKAIQRDLRYDDFQEYQDNPRFVMPVEVAGQP